MQTESRAGSSRGQNRSGTRRSLEMSQASFWRHASRLRSGEPLQSAQDVSRLQTLRRFCAEEANCGVKLTNSRRKKRLPRRAARRPIQAGALPLPSEFKIEMTKSKRKTPLAF